MWWGPDITPGGSEKQCVDTQRESGDLLLTYAWYQLPKLKAHSRVNWVAPLRCTFISPQTRRKQGCSACSKLQVWKGKRSKHLKLRTWKIANWINSQCPQNHATYLSTWPSTYLYNIHIYIYSLSFYSYIPDHFCISYHHPPVPFLFCSIHFLILIHAISHLSRLNRSSGLKKSCTMSGYWKHSPSACFVQKSGVNNEGLMAISRTFDYVWLSTTHNWKCTPHKCDINL